MTGAARLVPPTTHQHGSVVSCVSSVHELDTVFQTYSPEFGSASAATSATPRCVPQPAAAQPVADACHGCAVSYALQPLPAPETGLVPGSYHVDSPTYAPLSWSLVSVVPPTATTSFTSAGNCVPPGNASSPDDATTITPAWRYADSYVVKPLSGKSLLSAIP